MPRQHYHKQYNNNPKLKLLDLPQEIKDMIYGYVSSKCYIIDLAGLWEIGAFYVEGANDTFGFSGLRSRHTAKRRNGYLNKVYLKITNPNDLAGFFIPSKKFAITPQIPAIFTDVECLVVMDWRSTISVRDRGNIRDMEPHDFESSHPSPQEIR